MILEIKHYRLGLYLFFLLAAGCFDLASSPDSHKDISTCSDGVLNGNETSIDCGGEDCSPCEDYQSSSTDSSSDPIAACVDNILNGNETSVDCGGSDCPACKLGGSCNEGNDCITHYCHKTCGLAPSCLEILASSPNAPSGVYTIDTDGSEGSAAPFQVYCDMTTDSGGWTMVLNLDTSDGHVMWWGNPKWTNDEHDHGLTDPFAGDHKSPAWSLFTGATKVLLMVHEQEDIVGFKSFAKVDLNSMSDHMKGKDNTLFADEVLTENVGRLWELERLVRLSTELYANHCIQQDGKCTEGNGGTPDGDRIASHESVTGNNAGGGLGNWHDMGSCCGEELSDKTCNGLGVRTASEAQAGWAPGSSYHPEHGYFGSDSYLDGIAALGNTDCNAPSETHTATHAEPNSINYDYALFLREDDCENNLKDGNETDLNCGGVCGGCLPGATCRVGSDCLSGSCNEGICTGNYRSSCAHLQDEEPDTPSGYYRIDPDGPPGSAYILAKCDMETAGGGWTVIERSPFESRLGGTPVHQAIGKPLHEDAPVNTDNPASNKYRVSKEVMEELQALSSEMYVHCGGDDHLLTSSDNLFIGQDTTDANDRHIINFTSASLDHLHLNNLKMCVWPNGRGAFYIQEDTQLDQCGLAKYPWTGAPRTIPPVNSADIFAVDTVERDASTECHRLGSVREIMVRGRCSSNVQKDDQVCTGACPPCTLDETCNSGADCESGLCVEQTCAPPLPSCKELLKLDDSARSGMYTIDPGNGPIAVPCDMTTDGGGWTQTNLEDFESEDGALFWSKENETFECGIYDHILGHSKLSNENPNQKTFSLKDVPHQEVRIMLDYIKIDTWDVAAGDRAIIEVGDETIFEGTFCDPGQECDYPGGAQLCAGWPYGSEHLAPINVTVEHLQSDSLTLTFAAELDQSFDDESWAIDNLEIWVR